MPTIAGTNKEYLKMPTFAGTNKEYLKLPTFAGTTEQVEVQVSVLRSAGSYLGASPLASGVFSSSTPVRFPNTFFGSRGT